MFIEKHPGFFPHACSCRSLVISGGASFNRPDAGMRFREIQKGIW